MSDQTTYAPSSESYGPRRFLLKIYNYMAGALLPTGATAWFSAHSPAILQALYVIKDDQAVALRPVSLSILFLAFTGESIARVFCHFGYQRTDFLRFDSLRYAAVKRIICAPIKRQIIRKNGYLRRFNPVSGFSQFIS